MLCSTSASMHCRANDAFKVTYRHRFNRNGIHSTYYNSIIMTTDDSILWRSRPVWISAMCRIACSWSDVAKYYPNEKIQCCGAFSAAIHRVTPKTNHFTRWLARATFVYHRISCECTVRNLCRRTSSHCGRLTNCIKFVMR